jgi:hypothetical protein
LQKIVKVKEKVKQDKDRIGIAFAAKWNAIVLGKDGLYHDLTNGKRYKEINIDTTNNLSDNDKTRY